MSDPAIVSRLQNLNKFLEAVYLKPTRLSDILDMNGYTASEMESLKGALLESFLERIMLGIRCLFERYRNGGSLAAVCALYFGYESAKNLELLETDPRFAWIYSDNGRHLDNAVGRLRHRPGRRHLASVILCAADQSLGDWKQQTRPSFPSLEDPGQDDDSPEEDEGE